MNATSYTSPGVKDVNRESLADEMTILEPEKTPFTSLISKNNDATATFHEVTADRLAAPSASGSREGDSGPKGGDKTSKMARFGAYLHRWFRSFGVTDVQEAIAKRGGTAGISGSLYANNKLKAVREVKRDVEMTCLGFQDTQGGSDTAMKSRGVFKWCAASQTPAVDADYLTPTAQIVTGNSALLESTLVGVLTSLSDQYGGSEEYQMFVGNTYSQDLDMFTAYFGGSGGTKYTSPTVLSGDREKTVSFIVRIFECSQGRVVIHPSKFINMTAAGALNAYSGDSAAIINPEHWFLSFLEEMHSADDEEDAGGQSGYVKAIGGLYCKMPRGNAVIYNSLNS
jgi:hypothetical protein